MSKNKKMQQKKALKKRRKDKIQRKSKSVSARPVKNDPSDINYSMCSYEELFPEAGESHGLQLINVEGVPAGDYMMVDYHCSNPNCDCQDILLDVVEQSEGLSVALIDFDLTGKRIPQLNSNYSQSSYAAELFEVFQDTLNNPEYFELLKAHHRQLKTVTRKPTTKQRKVLRKYQEKN